ncbi:unnamed protein product [Phytophthora fragariaefolia]|uniref:Unnamed protein product n=1 Tax=Phytophthora fragariaefolia TaxID=1490495 RepID=A0A9W6XXX3_9STRA|nr:unnamed protein product [Phytophthora fragariaefolia]
MDECIDHLLFLQQSAEDQYNYKVKRVGFRYNHGYDKEMSMLAKLSTQHACNLVEEQYRVSVRETYEISRDDNGSILFTVSRLKSSAQYAVSLSDSSYGDADRFADTMQKFNIEDIETPPSHVLGHNEKYRSGLAVCQRIAEVVADKGSRSFQSWLNYLLNLEKVARHNDVPPPHFTEELDTHSVGSPLLLVDNSYQLTIRRSSAWHQKDGHNCGVLVVKWFETYLKVAFNTRPGEDLKDLTRQAISVEDLDACRYDMFQSVMLDVTASNFN